MVGGEAPGAFASGGHETERSRLCLKQAMAALPRTGAAVLKETNKHVKHHSLICEVHMFQRSTKGPARR